MDSLSVPGVDGVVLVIGWNYTEPAMGQYKWDTLDYWMSTAIALAKKVDLVVDAGIFTPSWLFQPAPTGAGAIPLTFKISPHEGKTAKCQSETIAPPWDTVYLAQWDSMLTTLAAHLRSVGTYKAVTLLRLTGINRSTDELRLPAETPQSTGDLTCVSDAISIWQQAGYRPSLLLQAWDEITDSFKRNFPDKSFSVAIIPPGLSPFPPIDEDGSVITGTVPDQDEPLLALASRKLPSHLVVQFNFLLPSEKEGGQAANPTVIQAAETLGTMAAFQTNNWLAANTKEAGAACGGKVTNSTPCTAATYLELLQNGIYPLYPDKSLRAVYIEVWPSNLNAFPDDIQQAHLELVAPLRNPPGLLKGWALFNMSVVARAVTHAIFLNGTHRVELAEIAINASSNSQMIENVAFNMSVVKIDFDHDGSVELALNSSAKPSAVYADDMQLGEAQSSNSLNLSSNEWVYDNAHHMLIIFADPSSITIFYSPTSTPVPEFPSTLTVFALFITLSASLVLIRKNRSQRFSKGSK